MQVEWRRAMCSINPQSFYRLRIASTTALASLNFAISGHKMIVVEADGNYVQPFETNDLYIYSGESYSVLITTNQNKDNYFVSIGQVARNSNTSHALTLLNYQNIPIQKNPSLSPPVTPKWDDFQCTKTFSDQIFAREGTTPPSKKHNHRIVLLNPQNMINGYTKWAINNVSLKLPITPYLGSMKYGLKHAFDQKNPPEKFAEDYNVLKPPTNPNTTIGKGVYRIDYMTTVDVVLQNANVLKEDTSEIHPWHLHGHHFWVLVYGEGKFRDGDEKKFNLKNPPLRNTALVYPHGWTALGFVADNPGVWAFHCHIEPHLHMGMGVIFSEGIEHVNGIPNKAIACGLIRKKFMHVNKH